MSAREIEAIPMAATDEGHVAPGNIVDLDAENNGEAVRKPFQKKARKRTSKVWDDFIEIVLPDDSKKAECIFCKERFTLLPSGVTSHLGRHLKNCLKRSIGKTQQHLVPQSGGNSNSNNLATFKYDHSKVREAAAHMILVHEYPFAMMEHALFNKFMKTTSPYWQKISRATARSDCIATYEIEKKRLKDCLKKVSKVGITTDLWKSGQKIQYMVVTGHFIDEDWKLQKRVLNFCNVPPPHSGVIIADALHKCLVEWGIESKVSTITVDNASYNDVALRILKETFGLRKQLFYGGKIFHVRCCAHIVNLLVQDGLSEIGDIIDTIRDGIKYLRYSESRLNKFAEIAKHLQLPSKKLILDCPTRWNGTYLMLVAALEFKDVFSMYQERDSSFNYMPTIEDWVKIENICQFLAIFHDVTEIISGSEYPTSNLFLSEVWRIKEILNEKSRDENIYIRAMTLKMRAKFDKYWGECNMLMAIAAILDPRYKMVLVEFCFPVIYAPEEGAKNIKNVFVALKELYGEYAVAYTSSAHEKIVQQNSTDNYVSDGSFNVGKHVASGRSRYETYVRQADVVQPIKSDLDIYLEESVYICDEGADMHFDALEWWKVNALKYRVLSKMARDILSIPITSVASEVTFSAGTRVIDQYRSSLSTDTVQALLCGSDWVRALHGLHRASKAKAKVESYEEVVLP